jgi:DNA-binding ferritin-like protein
MLLLIKLYHWNTTSYSTHKATDELYGRFNETMDHFVEVMLGTSGERVMTPTNTTIPLVHVNDNEGMQREINTFLSFLKDLSTNSATAHNTDLLNIRDELLAHLHQFLYLLRLR